MIGALWRKARLNLRATVAVGVCISVLADKPAVIEPADLPRLEAALTMANEQQLVLADMMTGLQLLDLMLEFFADHGHWTRGYSVALQSAKAK